MIPAPSLLPTSQDYGEAWRAQLRLAGLARRRSEYPSKAQKHADCGAPAMVAAG